MIRNNLLLSKNTNLFTHGVIYRHDQKTVCKILSEHSSAQISHAKSEAVLPFLPIFSFFKTQNLKQYLFIQKNVIKI